MKVKKEKNTTFFFLLSVLVMVFTDVLVNCGVLVKVYRTFHWMWFHWRHFNRINWHFIGHQFIAVVSSNLAPANLEASQCIFDVSFSLLIVFTLLLNRQKYKKKIPWWLFYFKFVYWIIEYNQTRGGMPLTLFQVVLSRITIDDLKACMHGRPSNTSEV